MRVLSGTTSRVLVAGCAMAVGLSLSTFPVAADVSTPPSWGQVPAAEAALAQAQAVMAGTSSAVEPTIALRDLALLKHQLEGADRRAAEALLARPNGGGNSDPGFAVWGGNEANASVLGGGCSDDPATPVCVHWTNQGTHAPPAGDADADQVPDWVEATLAEMEHVWLYQVGTLGYRPPLTDERASIDNDGVFFDVYLSDLGSRGYYGYCTLDDSRTRSAYRHSDFAGYCVLDNDFARSQFPTHTPLKNMQVTAAHEFFHAIQFAYDVREDIWFMEGTAAWMEEEVYDDVNDNRQYLRTSQFKNSQHPLDVKKGLWVYGSWGFFEYLSERLGPEVVRRAWERADDARGGPDDYSLQAIRRATHQSGGDLTRLLGRFGLALAEPKAFLSEGAAFPSSVADRFTLRRTGSTTQWQRYTLDHTSFAPIELLRGRDVRGDARLAVRLDAPRRSASPEVYLMAVRTDGSYSPPQRVQLNRQGFGAASITFGRDTRRVVLSLGNASTDFRRCFSRTTAYSCHGGVPEHDDQRFWFKATVR